ncbi:universal stress protein UspE [Vibrio cincinnatiensis]|jgi:universal stress protein E|uniref:Universal stress protein E n=1 Tax=Vibrio cincinnatiensis DSM 19608 TaxID=1123491 RepID=A0A1T4RKW3_VIBCI|nr:universal stress protein UspE [Vibrio cincinnatiensis]MCG3721364.1 universal stress protein UspE [Vibrio cincinnatiensis]MCG3725587.1 universal stress protein UspE [Vibrio cincinnatiensis]MCG3732090.1 universal stress protein UspE [Vibrio cincinnatiensis]MCG3736258.1 universal stress protein UspE [Vibrio cincinnatiensis]MCG3739801.1 universal stress protein UspE [Vibrio cincinnatiensis]
MSIYNKILVVADINHDEQPALARAVQLAAKSRSPSQITFFMSIYDFSYDMTSMLSIDERDAMRRGVIHQREKWMKKVAEAYVDSSIQFSVKVVWHNRPYEAIIAEVFSGEHDILIKGTRKHDILESVIFTPTDWHLLRKCPTPVLLVKNADWPEQANILASVHVGSEVETHLELNDIMVDQLLNLTARLDATPYLVNAYPVTPANITIELPEFDPTTYTDAVRGHHLTAMKALRQKHGLNEEQTIVQQGLPEDVIPAAAEKLNAAMVILGTTGRTGLSAVFIGNTAEQVIDKINCDVLALKPKGYISPLDPKIAS